MLMALRGRPHLALLSTATRVRPSAAPGWRITPGVPPQDDANVLFLAGSDANANGLVAQLIRDLGAEPIDLGPIDQGGLLIAMGGPLTNKFKLFTKADAQAVIDAAH